MCKIAIYKVAEKQKRDRVIYSHISKFQKFSFENGD